MGYVIRPNRSLFLLREGFLKGGETYQQKKGFFLKIFGGFLERHLPLLAGVYTNWGEKEWTQTFFGSTKRGGVLLHFWGEGRTLFLKTKKGGGHTFIYREGRRFLLRERKSK